MQGKFLGGCVWVGVTLAVSCLSFGCGSASSCSRAEDEVTVEFSPEMLTDGVYFSAPYGGPYQLFPGGRTLHFKHGLGTTPLPPAFWLAFFPEGKGDNPLGQAAGNLAELVGLDADEIAVKNNTCTEFHIWFYAQAQPQ